MSKATGMRAAQGETHPAITMVYRCNCVLRTVLGTGLWQWHWNHWVVIIKTRCYNEFPTTNIFFSFSYLPLNNKVEQNTLARFFFFFFFLVALQDLWYLSCLIRDWTLVPAVKAPNLNHGAAGEFPCNFISFKYSFTKWIHILPPRVYLR